MRHARTRTGCRVAPVPMSISISLSMSCDVMNSRPVAPSSLSGQRGQVMRQAAPHVLPQYLYLQYLHLCPLPLLCSALFTFFFCPLVANSLLCEIFIQALQVETKVDSQFFLFCFFPSLFFNYYCLRSGHTHTHSHVHKEILF